MTNASLPSAFARHDDQATLTIKRLLPGPIERVWDYLTRSELRRKWLAAGDMTLEKGAAFTFTWRNDELTTPPGERPPGNASEHSMECRIVDIEPLRRLEITWGRTGGVVFTLAERGRDVLLTIVHRRVPDRGMLLSVSAGWHTHLDVLVATLEGTTPAPFWDEVARLKPEYDRRIPR